MMGVGLEMSAAYAPPPLSRTFTAPATSHSRQQPSSGGSPISTNTQTNSSYSAYSQASTTSLSSSSTLTAATSNSSLFPPTQTGTPVNGGPVEASDNVLNRVADKEASLFMSCVKLRQRLRAVPGFEEALLEEEQDADEDTDPVTLLWRTFRQGYPLMTIYNCLQPAVPLEVDEAKVSAMKRGKAAAFKFLQACLTELKFPGEECFFITDLYGDDTTGFVKVAKVVNRVLDILVERGLIDPVEEEYTNDGADNTGKRTQRQHIVEELVKTERTYVQHLEQLQAFKKLVEEKGVIPGDDIHDIFLNLNALLDFQRRFLIRVEQINAQPESEQNWGKLFVLYSDAFLVYEAYIANQKRCEDTAMKDFERLREIGVSGTKEMRDMLASPTILTSFLLKPFQRLTKYPLLLQSLRDKGDLDEERKNDVIQGIESASQILHRSNAAVDRAERDEAIEELKSRVEDWKGHRVEQFGDLLLFGSFTVLKGEIASSKDNEREVRDFHVELNVDTRDPESIIGASTGQTRSASVTTRSAKASFVRSPDPGSRTPRSRKPSSPALALNNRIPMIQDSNFVYQTPRNREPSAMTPTLNTKSSTVSLKLGHHRSRSSQSDIEEFVRQYQHTGSPAPRCFRTFSKSNHESSSSSPALSSRSPRVFGGLFGDGMEKNENDRTERRPLNLAGRAIRKLTASDDPFTSGNTFFDRPFTDFRTLSFIYSINANRFGAFAPVLKQYKVYLFQSILLCCKEINPNKQKNKILNKPLTDKKGKLKLQLKGRIFMQNVTETVSLAKPGSYTCQIFWKGDPGIENFVIRFTTEEVMKKWVNELENQRRKWKEFMRQSAGKQQSAGTSDQVLTSMRNMGPVENPYLRQDDDDDEDDDLDSVIPAYSHPDLPIALPRNGSSNSLRSRSTTGDSGPGRIPPPRFPIGQPLSLRTQQLQQAASPGEFVGDSYFSPTAESPISTRTSGSSAGMFPFPRQQPPSNGWHGDEPNRFTAPAIGRSASRDGQNAMSNGRGSQRPSLPASASAQSMAQSRLRSASSPDIQNPILANRRLANGNHPPVPDVPVPPFPTHYAHIPNLVNRSQNNSPNSMSSAATRIATQTPNLSSARSVASSDGGAVRPLPVMRNTTPAPVNTEHRNVSPPLASAPPRSVDIPTPTQLKVKVHVPAAGSTMTLVVSTNISYQSLKDRIDAKLQRYTNLALASGTVKLKYLDDDDYVSIQSDEDVQTAFETWREQQREPQAGSLGEIELYCLG